MFTVKAPETFKATLTVVGQGREQKLPLVFRHRTRSDYTALLKKIGDGEADAAESILDLIESWDADAELSKATLDGLDDAQPGALWAILTGYGQALGVARKGN